MNADKTYHCPGQSYSISAAVCRGRQSANFYLCETCDEGKGSGRMAKAKDGGQPRAEKAGTQFDSIFKAYDIRGVYPDPLNEEAAWRIGHAAASFLRSMLTGYARSERQANSIVVGRDVRPSSPALQDALIEGLRSTNTDVIDIGLIDTPMLYFAVNHLGVCGGVQVTASHNPAQYNGFKVCGQGARPVGQDTGLWEIKRIAETVRRHKVTLGGQRTARDLWGLYRDFIGKFLDRDLRKLKIVVDGSNGSAGKMVPALFSDLPVEIVPLNFAPLGEFRHEPNPLLESSLADLKAAVAEHGADFGVCFDGDADRCVFVDETGRSIPCDLITALLAPMFLADRPGAVVVCDVRASRVVAEEVLKAGGVPRRERVGHAFIKKAMRDADAVFAGEGSGHFYFKDYWFADSGALVFAHMLNLVSRRKQPLSKLIRPLERYAASGEINFINDHQDRTIAELRAKYGPLGQVDAQDGLRVDFPDWWFNVRKSNTEPLLRLNAEATGRELLEEKMAELAPLLGERAAH